MHMPTKGFWSDQPTGYHHYHASATWPFLLQSRCHRNKVYSTSKYLSKGSESHSFSLGISDNWFTGRCFTWLQMSASLYSSQLCQVWLPIIIKDLHVIILHRLTNLLLNLWVKPATFPRERIGPEVIWMHSIHCWTCHQLTILSQNPVAHGLSNPMHNTRPLTNAH